MNEEQHLQLKMSLFNVYVSNADAHCSSPNDALGPSELNPSGCQQHIQETLQYWHRMECGNETPTSIDKICCSSWYEQLTSCFSKKPSWEEDCVRMWSCRRNEKPRKQFFIILRNRTDSSYLGRIKVKQCGARKPNFPAIKLIPSSEVRVFDFLVTFLVPIVIGPLISPLRECRNQSPSWPQSAQLSIWAPLSRGSYK